MTDTFLAQTISQLPPISDPTQAWFPADPALNLGPTGRLSALQIGGVGTYALPTIAALRGLTIAPSSGSLVVRNFAIPGDLGGGLFVYVSADQSSADNGGTIIVDAGQRRWYRVYAGLVACEWFGAYTANADNAAAINAALAVGPCSLSAGLYLHASEINLPDNRSLVGSGRTSTTLVATFLIGTAISLGLDSQLSSLWMTATAPRTAGASVLITKNGSKLSDFTMSNYFGGVGIVGPSFNNLAVDVEIVDGDMFGPATGAGSFAISGANYGNLTLRSLVGSGAATGVQPQLSVVLTDGDTAFLDDLNFTLHGSAAFAPTAGQTMFATHSTDCFFDSCNNGPALSIGGAGGFYDGTFTACWFGLSTGGNGLDISSAGGGAIDGVICTGCKYVGNSGNGVSLNGAGVKNVQVNGGYASANTLNGALLEGGATFVQFTGLRAGNVANRGPNGGYGIKTQDACNDYTIIGCVTGGNTTGGLSDGASGGTKSVANNI